MTHEVISTPQAPAAIGPYAQGRAAGNLIFLSGQIGIEPTSGKLVNGGTGPQAHQVFENIRSLAIAAELSLAAVVKLAVFLVDLEDYSQVNEIMRAYFQAPYPARSAVAVAALPLGARIEVEAILAR